MSLFINAYHVHSDDINDFNKKKTPGTFSTLHELSVYGSDALFPSSLTAGKRLNASAPPAALDEHQTVITNRHEIKLVESRW